MITKSDKAITIEDGKIINIITLWFGILPDPLRFAMFNYQCTIYN
jgi:hypothetical protein